MAMKKYLLLPLFVLNCFGANPAFTGFDTNDFIVTPPTIKTRISGIGTTNYYLSTTNYYDNSVTIYTNVITISTNVITIYTNVYITNSYLFVNGTNVGTINPTDGYLPVRANGTTFTNSSWYQIDLNTMGFRTTNPYFLGATPTAGFRNVALGYDALTNAVAYSGYGNSVLGYEAGEYLRGADYNVIIGYQAGRTGTNSDNNVIIGASAGANTSGSTGSCILIGSSAGQYNAGAYTIAVGVNALSNNRQGAPDGNTAIGYQALNDQTNGLYNLALGYEAGYINGNSLKSGSWNTFLGSSSGAIGIKTNTVTVGFGAIATNNNEIVIGNTNNTAAIFPITSYTGAGTKALTDDGTYKTFAGSSTTINSLDGYLPARGNATTFTNSWLYNTANGVATDTNIFFGPGTTNVLTKNDTNLRYTNGAANVDIEVINGSGKQALFGINTGGQVEVRAGTGINALSLSDGTDIITLFAGGFRPATYPIDLGSGANPWGPNFVMSGFQSGGTSHSRLAISHTGTNGAVVLDSQSAGIAGPPRGFVFATNGVTKATIATNGDLTIAGMMRATNGYHHELKTSFYTNYTCDTSTQFHLLSGTNQLITLPTAASAANMIYRFSMTNGYGSFVLTNAADGAKIRDGASLSYTNIGINEVGLVSDGSNWWLASKGKTVFPAASWSLTNSITPSTDTITNIPFTTLEFNNSQGIALRTKAGYAGATELAVTNSGTYMITFSAMLQGTATVNAVLSVWLRQDGSDVTRTRTDTSLRDANDVRVMTVNYFVPVGAPTFFELCAASHAANCPIILTSAANPTGYTAPSAPGIIVTVNRISDTWP
jgi:hypothetical protein